MFLSVFVYIETDSSRRINKHVCWSAFVSFSFSLSVSVSGYVTGNLHIYEQVGPAQTVCNSVIEIKEKEKKKERNFFFFVFKIFHVYVHLLIRISVSLFECR